MNIRQICWQSLTNKSVADTIYNLLTKATEQLAHSSTPRLDVEVLLQHALDCDRAYLYAHSDLYMSETQSEKFNEYITLRSQGLPVAYITGSKEFWSLNLQVTVDTLIPRPETELLVETTLKLLSGKHSLSILELGTGSGAIALALAKELPHANIVATDISEVTLAVAINNADRLRVTNIDFIISDWFDAVPELTFDIIISNPPYINAEDPHLHQGDVRFEPRNALVSQQLGLADLYDIIKHSHRYLKPQGCLIVEHGYDQGQSVRAFMQQQPFTTSHAVFDLAGHHRATYTVKN